MEKRQGKRVYGSPDGKLSLQRWTYLRNSANPWKQMSDSDNHWVTTLYNLIFLKKKKILQKNVNINTYITIIYV